MPSYTLEAFNTRFRMAQRSRMNNDTHAALAWLITVALALSSSAQSRRSEQLVPASFSQVTDVNGNPWDVQTNGRIGNGYNDCFDGAMYLRVNGTEFQASSRLMRASPREYVLSSSLGSVKVTRRILIDTQRGAARYLDIFENLKAGTVSLNVQLRTMLGGSCQQVVNSAGQPFSGVFGKKDSGLCAIHSSYRPCVYFLVADPRSKQKPTVSVQSNRTFMMNYNLKLKPRKSISLLHVIAQRRNLSASGVAAVAKQFFDRRPVEMQIPKPLARTVCNFRFGPVDYFDAGPLLQPVMDLSDYLGVARGEGDFLVLGDEARFKGQLQGTRFLVKTRFGQTAVPLEHVAMLIGGNGVSRRMQLFLRNGEVILGDIATDGDFVFRGEQGLDVQLRPESLDVLLMRTNKETDGKADDDASAIITTQEGLRLAARNPQETKLELATAWGPLNVSLSDLGRLWIEEDPVPTFRVLLSNLSNLPLLPAGDDLVIDTRRWGKVRLKFSEVNRIVNLKLKGTGGEEDEQNESRVPFCLLAGETKLAATIDLKLLPVTTATGVAQVDVSSIRRLARSETDDAIFVAVLDNGEEMTGTIPLRFLPVRMGGQVWRVPLQQFLEVHLKREGVSDEGGQGPESSDEKETNSRSTTGTTRSQPTAPAVSPSRIQPPTSVPRR